MEPQAPEPIEMESADIGSTLLASLSDDDLLVRLRKLVAQSRRVEADLVAHIGEVDERRLYARFAFSSMFGYCTQGLHLSEAGAYRRITVARAARQHPMLLSMLRDGRLHLSALAALVGHLTLENRDAVLARAIHAPKRAIESLVAELSPRPDVASSIRKLPARSAALGAAPEGADSKAFRPGLAAALLPISGDEPAATDARSTLPAAPGHLGSPASAPGHPSPAPRTASTLELSPGRVRVSQARPQRHRAAMGTLSPERYKVQFTASAALRDKIECLTALMRSEVPDGDLATVIDRAVTEKLERLEARRFGKTKAPRKSVAQSDTRPATRHVPAAVRRSVYERDQGRCRFVGEDGRRCSEQRNLEYHHRFPFGIGGDHAVANIGLLCPTHNRYVAELDYGRGKVQSQIETRGGRKVALRSPTDGSVVAAKPS